MCLSLLKPSQPIQACTGIALPFAVLTICRSASSGADKSYKLLEYSLDTIVRAGNIAVCGGGHSHTISVTPWPLSNILRVFVQLATFRSGHCQAQSSHSKQICQRLHARKRVFLQAFILTTRVVAWNKNSPNVVHACRKRRLNWIPSVRGYSWTTLSLEDMNTEAWSTGLWLGVRLTPTPSETIVVKKFQEM